MPPLRLREPIAKKTAGLRVSGRSTNGENTHVASTNGASTIGTTVAAGAIKPIQRCNRTQVPIVKLNHRISRFVAAAAFGLAVAGSAIAAGCFKGAVVGGVAGHYAGHHAVAGAIGDCIVGHHIAKKQAEERAAQQQAIRSQKPSS